MTQPEAADMELLWQGLEDAIAHPGSNEQLLIAGDAIAQIVEVNVKGANGILDSLEVTDSSEGPILGEDFLLGLMRSSRTMDLSDLMEDFAFDEVESNPASIGSQVTVIERKEAGAIASGTAAQSLVKPGLL